MKKLFFLLLIIISTVSYSQKRIYPVKQGDGGLFLTGGANAGDTVVLSAKYNPWLWVFTNIKVDNAKRIIIAAEGNVIMTGGIAFKDAQGFTVNPLALGNGNSLSIKNKNGSAFSIDGLSKDISIFNVNTDSSQFGVFMKNEPGCDTALNKWVISNIEISYNRFTHITAEGIYAGSTNVTHGDSINKNPIYCNGVLKVVHPPLLANIRINHNLFDGCGRGGVQLSFAQIDTSDISFNTIKHTGREFNDQQGNGINIGTGSVVKVHDNNITNTLLAGIASFGQYTEIFNNKIDSSGYLDGHYTNWAWGIWLDTRETDPFVQSRVKVYNNIVGVRGNGNGTWYDLLLADQYKKDGSGWFTDNVIADNVSSVTGKPITSSIQAGIGYVTTIIKPIPNPIQVTIFHKGYFTLSGKRFYYVMYSDGTYAQTNSKYQPL